jgi:hypothetical protein
VNVEKTVKFLTSIWEAQGTDEEGYVFLSRKTPEGAWEDLALNHPVTDAARLVKPLARWKGSDIYFCPNVFSEPYRQKQHVLPSVWLYADLDESNPESLPVAPTSAWKTSKRRYQCLWRSTKALPAKTHGVLNQRLTYLCDADKGGWSVTKVLRVPGTQNHKRANPEHVRLLWHDLQHYRPTVLRDLVKGVKVGPMATGIQNVSLPDMTADAILHKHKQKMSKRTLELLRAKVAQVGERSDRLWELDCLLLDAGVSPEETLILVRETVWNKYAGTRRELDQLWVEVTKAKDHVTEPKFSPTAVLREKFQTYDEFLSTPVPSEVWTVEGVWSHDAHGLIAGEPKTFKSFVAMDLAVSVASGTKFLGHFEVPETGPVIMIQEENTPAMMKDRLEKITHSRGIGESAGMNGNGSDGVLEMKARDDLPIFLMNNAQFNLTDEDHLSFLEKLVQTHKPKLLILDPLYLMIPGLDENSAAEMGPTLRTLLALKQTHNVGILIVHHYNKPRVGEDRQPGNRISGTNAFYRWFESALYLEKGKAIGEVLMTPEHRGSVPRGAIKLEFDLGEMGDTEYHVDVTHTVVSGTKELRKDLKDLIQESPGISVIEAGEALDISKFRVKRLAERLGYEIRLRDPKGQAGRPGYGIFPQKGRLART